MRPIERISKVALIHARFSGNIGVKEEDLYFAIRLPKSEQEKMIKTFWKTASDPATNVAIQACILLKFLTSEFIMEASSLSRKLPKRLARRYTRTQRRSGGIQESDIKL